MKLNFISDYREAPNFLVLLDNNANVVGDFFGSLQSYEWYVDVVGYCRATRRFVSDHVEVHGSVVVVFTRACVCRW